jgi:predicted acylesterase/phospholipase RssA
LHIKDIVFNSSVVRSTTPSANIMRSTTNATDANYRMNIEERGLHPVLQLIQKRVETKSLPGARDKNDTAILALSIEGGGMRGAVSAGMAAAISCLGLADAFDSIYGSSAGSVIGAYLISRQM